MLRPRLPRLVALAGMLAALTACNNFDQQNQLNDLRILGMVTEPAEILYSALYTTIPIEDRFPGFPLPEYDVNVTVYAFDPRGAPGANSTMQLCPDGQDASCIDFDHAEWVESRIFSEDPAQQEEDRAAIGALLTPQSREHDAVDRAADPTGQFVQMSYDYTFTVPVMDALLRNRDGVAGFDIFPSLPRFVMDLENPSAFDVRTERAFKRLPLGLDLNDPALPPGFADALVQVLGLKLCGEDPNPDTFVEGPADCLFPKTTNQNPIVVGFDFYDAQAEEEAFLETGIPPVPIHFGTRATIGATATIRAHSGARLNLRPILAPGAVEAYQVYTFDIDNQSITLENRYEDPIISWYTTAGSAPGQTQTQLQSSLDVVWTLPFFDDIAPEDWADGDPLPRAALFGMLRDQRGGAAPIKIIVEVRPDDPDIPKEAAGPGGGLF